MKRHLVGLICGVSLVFVGCADKERRPSMDVCTAGAQCELGYCIDGLCIDPMGDEDLDGLLNEIEVMLGTDPFDADTDQDGLEDGLEIGEFVDPSDSDGDGLYDALESSLVDEDCDGLSNQADAVFSELACDDEITCTDDLCEPAKGCVHTAREGACDDQDPCTLDDACVDSVCVGGTPDGCDDGLPCTHDVCDPTQGCTHTALEGACDDGDPCTSNDACVDSICVGGPPEVKNLVQNGDGESFSGWSLPQNGVWGQEDNTACDEAPEPTSGFFFLFVGDVCGAIPTSPEVQIEQDLWISDVTSEGEELNVQIHAMVGAVYEQTVAIILLEPFDSTGASLGEPLRYEVQQSPWVELIDTVPIPAETDKITLTLRAERQQSGPLSAVFDDLHVGVLGCAD